MGSRAVPPRTEPSSRQRRTGQKPRTRRPRRVLASARRGAAVQGDTVLGRWGAPLWILIGSALVFAVLLPILVAFGEQTRVIWFWDQMRGGQGLRALAVPLPLLAGSGVILVGTNLKGQTRGAIQLCMGVVTLLVWVLAGSQGSSVPRTLSWAFLGVILLAVSSIGVCVGSGLRSVSPSAALPRLLGGISGAVFTLCYLVPWEGDLPVVDLFSRGYAWHLVLGALGLLASGVLATVNLARLRPAVRLAQATLITQWSAFGVAWLGLLLSGTPFTVWLKAGLFLFGLFFLLALGAFEVLLPGVRTAEPRSAGERQPAPRLAPQSQGRPREKAQAANPAEPGKPAVPDRLRKKLEKLRHLRKKGVLSHREYLEKRREIIEATRR